MIASITRAYTRYYSDTQQVKAYVEWVDHKGNAGRTEGDMCKSRTQGASRTFTLSSQHMGALFDRALREGVTIERETW